MSDIYVKIRNSQCATWVISLLECCQSRRQAEACRTFKLTHFRKRRVSCFLEHFLWTKRTDPRNHTKCPLFYFVLLSGSFLFRLCGAVVTLPHVCSRVGYPRPSRRRLR